MLVPSKYSDLMLDEIRELRMVQPKLQQIEENILQRERGVGGKIQERRYREKTSISFILIIRRISELAKP